MIREYSIVEAKRPLSVKVGKGCKGTVLICYPPHSTTLTRKFEVEFYDPENDDFIEILTVAEEDLDLIYKPD